MKQNFIIFIVLLGVLLLVPGNLFPTDTPDPTERLVYGHISLLEGTKGEVRVIREDQQEDEAVVNLPIAPGDRIITGEKGRCELQFDNGTIIRLDNNTHLKVTTVLAKSLTSQWKITTLDLEKGQVYTMSAPYNMEIFQIMTPNAAAKLKGRSISTIHNKENGETQLFCHKGKFSVLLGENKKLLETYTIRSGQGITITPDRQILTNVRPGIDFLAWNEKINENFKELHYGISKLPKKIYRYNRAIVYWAEKWSSMYGEWVYHDQLGYTWKPNDELFLYNRPFFNADYVNVNGVLFLVPQEPWGWVPAHLGTWVFVENLGWVWVPGQNRIFLPGLWAQTWGYWLDYLYGWDFYYWRHLYDTYESYYTHYGHKPVDIQERLKKKINNPATGVISKKAKPGSISSRSSLAAEAKIKTDGSTTKLRDWNPDSKWASRNGFKIVYSSRTNEVVCPKLQAFSSQISYRDTVYLRRGCRLSPEAKRRLSGSGGSGSGSGSGSYTGSASADTTSRTSNSHTAHTGSSGGSAGSSKSKQ